MALWKYLNTEPTSEAWLKRKLCKARYTLTLVFLLTAKQKYKLTIFQLKEEHQYKHTWLKKHSVIYASYMVYLPWWERLNWSNLCSDWYMYMYILMNHKLEVFGFFADRVIFF